MNLFIHAICFSSLSASTEDVINVFCVLFALARSDRLDFVYLIPPDRAFSFLLVPSLVPLLFSSLVIIAPVLLVLSGGSYHSDSSGLTTFNSNLFLFICLFLL